MPVSLERGQQRCGGECSGPREGGLAGDGEQLLDDPASLAQVAELHPEEPQGESETQALVSGIRRGEQRKGGPQVGRLLRQCLQHLGLPLALEPGGAAFCKLQEVARLAFARLGACSIGQLLECVLADRLQHPEALVRVTDEALLDERLERVEVGVAGRFGGLEGATAVEDGQPGEQLFPVLVEQLVRPCDRRAEGLMAGLGVSASSEEVEPPAEPVEDLRRGKHGASRSCELDGERELVEAPAELGDRFVGLRSRALAEEADGVRLG